MLKIRKNPDEEMYIYARKMLEEHHGYCPCALYEAPEFKCPCQNFRNQDTPGLCYCGMYEKYEVGATKD